MSAHTFVSSIIVTLASGARDGNAGYKGGICTLPIFDSTSLSGCGPGNIKVVGTGHPSF